MMSNTIRSYCSLSARYWPSSPSKAWSTANPSSIKPFLIMLDKRRSSSTIKILIDLTLFLIADSTERFDCPELTVEGLIADVQSSSKVYDPEFVEGVIVRRCSLPYYIK